MHPYTMAKLLATLGFLYDRRLYIIVFSFNDTATTEIYTTVHTLSLHDALPISVALPAHARRALTGARVGFAEERRSEEHTSELQSRTVISYAVFCLKKKKR